MKPLGLSTGTQGKRVIVQGLGNVGYHAAFYLQTQGEALITGIAEREGGIFNPDGLDVETVWRDGEEITVRPRLVRREDDASLEAAWPGFTVLPLNDDLRNSMNLRNERGSIVVSDVYSGSPAAQAGLSRGDIIRQVNGEDVGSLAEFYRAVNGRSGDDLVFRLVRQGREYVIGLVR